MTPPASDCPAAYPQLLGVKMKFDRSAFPLPCDVLSQRLDGVFMRTIDRDTHIDELRRGSVVNEVGCSGDPGGITTHSSLSSCKVAWKQNAVRPDECTFSLCVSPAASL